MTDNPAVPVDKSTHLSTQMHSNDLQKKTKESTIPELGVRRRNCTIIPRHRELLPEGPGVGCLPLQTGFLMEN